MRKTCFIGFVSIAVTLSFILFVAGCGAKKEAVPVGIEKFADLGNENIKIAIGEPESVPAGKYTIKILEKLAAEDEALKTNIEKNIVTKEPNVRAVLDKVISKEVDAGFVYLTDAYSALDEVHIIDIPEKIQVTAKYPIGVLKETDDRRLADTFLNYVLSKDGQGILEKHGFAPTVDNPKEFSSEKFDGETLVVYAAISMTDAFEEMAANLRDLTGAQIKFKFGSSGSLRQTIESGAVGGESGADVFASASLDHMEGLKEKGFIEVSTVFTENKIVVVLPK